MQSPNFPATLEDLRAKVEFINIVDDGAAFRIGSESQITVRAVELCHPNSAFGFRIEYGGKSLVYSTDTENLPKPDERLVKLARGTDLLIHDAQYTREEYYGSKNGQSRKGCGHSTPEAAAEVAVAAKVKKLLLFHHDFLHDDAVIDQLVRLAADIFPNTAAASEGMVIEL